MGHATGFAPDRRAHLGKIIRRKGGEPPSRQVRPLVKEGRADRDTPVARPYWNLSGNCFAIPSARASLSV